MHKAKLIFIGMICLIPMLFTIPAHAVNGGSDPDPVVGIINDNLPMDSDGIGDLSDTDTITGVTAFAAAQDAEDATTTITTPEGASIWAGRDPHPPLIRVRTQYQVWTRDVPLTEPAAGGQDVHIQATITTEYFFWHGWPGSSWPGNHVAPFGVDLCYAFKGGKAPGILWNGINADASWFDDRNGIDVDNLRTGDLGRGGCIHENVPIIHRMWLKMIKHPAWLAQGAINWKLDGDQPFHWHSARIDDSKWLSPAKDPVITTKSGKVWHNIYKTW